MGVHHSTPFTFVKRNNKNYSQMTWLSILFCSLVLWCVPQPTLAVVPPDFVFSIGSQAIQFFSLMGAVLATICIALIQFFKRHIEFLKGHKEVLGIGVVVIMALIGGIWTWHESYLQNVAYTEWLQESQEQERIFNESMLADSSMRGSLATEETLDETESLSTVIDTRPLFVTNAALKQNLESGGLGDTYIVLDAREDIEFENGFFPGSVHIRFADLKAGRWQELLSDQSIYVICWSGIRGQEVVEFLRSQHLMAQYLEHGASGWVEDGGSWQGAIKFGDTYQGDQYQRVLTTRETKREADQGVWLVDTREPAKYLRSHIAGSVSIPLMHTRTEVLESKLAQVPVGATFITVCDGYVNCFDAKLTGVELERRGRIFLGRYNKPWEYE